MLPPSIFFPLCALVFLGLAGLGVNLWRKLGAKAYSAKVAAPAATVGAAYGLLKIANEGGSESFASLASLTWLFAMIPVAVLAGYVSKEKDYPKWILGSLAVVFGLAALFGIRVLLAFYNLFTNPSLAPELLLRAHRGAWSVAQEMAGYYFMQWIQYAFTAFVVGVACKAVDDFLFDDEGDGGLIRRSITRLRALTARRPA